MAEESTKKDTKRARFRLPSGGVTGGVIAICLAALTNVIFHVLFFSPCTSRGSETLISTTPPTPQTRDWKSSSSHSSRGSASSS